MKKLIFFLPTVAFTYTALAQPLKIDSSQYPRPMTFTVQQDISDDYSFFKCSKD